MNILIMTRTLTSGGAEKTAANLATILSKNNHQVYIAVFDMNNKTYDTIANIIDLSLYLNEKKRNPVIWYLKGIHRIKKVKRDYNVDVTISFLNEPDLINVLSPKGDVRVVSVRNYRSRLIKNKIQFIRDKYVFSKSDYIVSLSKGVKKDLIDYFGIIERKVFVIYNPCDVEGILRRAIESPNICFAEADPIIVTLGRLTEQKGQWHLIRAFSDVVKKIPNVKLLILGQGELKGYLEELIEGYNLSSSVILCGYLANPYSILKRGRLFVFSSLFEGLGNVLLEAMACGLPIISTDCPTGPREILEPDMNMNEEIKTVRYCKYGVLTPVCDGKRYTCDDSLTYEEKQISNAIIEILLNNELLIEYGEKSKKRVEDFSNETIAFQWENILKSKIGI